MVEGKGSWGLMRSEAGMEQRGGNILLMLNIVPNYVAIETSSLDYFLLLGMYYAEVSTMWQSCWQILSDIQH